MFSSGIGKPQADPSGNRRQPPNYYSWQMRWRLLVLVACVLFVPSLLVERVPILRSWLGLKPLASSSQPPLTSTEIADEIVDTRLTAPRDLADRDSVEPIVTGVADTNPLALPSAANEEQADALRAATRDRWARLRSELGYAERSRLLQVLKTARGGPPLSDDARTDWPPVLKQLDERWQQLNREATAALAELSDSEREVWSTVLEALNTSWSSEVQPALVAAGAGQPLSDSQRRSLADMQGVFDELAFAEVRDNTIMRGVEGDAWFRCFEQLQAADPSTLTELAVGRLGFVQLFKQPNEYRGKLVTVRGHVRLGYRVAAPPNDNGISSYCVYWLKPAGGPNRPIVIYALETPPGFPEIRDKGEPGPEIDEFMEVTGYFFKNWAYQAQDSTRVAPLLLARVPQWHPVAGRDSPLPSLGQVIAAAVVGIVVAGGVARYVYCAGRSQRTAESREQPPVKR